MTDIIQTRPFPDRNSKRKLVRHFLLGSPLAIRRTTHHLHALRCVDVWDWSMLSVVPRPLVLTPPPGEVIVMLERDIILE